MTRVNFKYLLIIFLSLALLVKVGNVLSYLKSSITNTELSSVNSDAAEKEEKKVENEFFTDHSFFQLQNVVFNVAEKKIIPLGRSFRLNYFPEVLTPPPSGA
ncbi:hypothetical protein ACJVDH_01455 [Pedobacter sp. AW1-32]|uniref:hypothetical protein n=1 Tax=Pedobacter sp. AW1-32 TaxID=3383026 RepID=UPI003FEF0E51